MSGCSDAELKRLIIDMRRDFHSHPELSGDEERTAGVIVGFFKSLGIGVYKLKNSHGVCAYIKGSAPGPVIALRADMDALPINEENDVPYRSLYPGVMHACGHDGHMAILLGAAVMLAEKRSEFPGTVKLIFQPAEEAAPVGGATGIINEGVLDDVDAIFGLHLWPDLPSGHVGIKAGALMAASDRFKVTVKGRGAHAANPHQGIDAIAAAAAAVQGLSTMISRQLDPVEVATLSIGTIHGGERYNVIAQEVCFEGTVRTLNDTVRYEIAKHMENVLKGLSEAYGTKYILDYQYGYPALNNYDVAADIVSRAAAKVIGRQAVHSDIKPTLGAEDFANYLQKIPGAFFWLGCTKADDKLRFLHNSSFDIDEDSLFIGAKLLCQIALDALQCSNFGGGSRVSLQKVII